jgi:chorismate synthase
MPLVFRAAFKPTPSIGKKQQTVNIHTLEPAVLEIGGRHDPCVAVRAVPVVEAVAAIVILDMLLEDEIDGSL